MTASTTTQAAPVAEGKIIHECPGHLPVCPTCGRKWAFVRTWSDGSKSYTSAAVVTRMQVLGYGVANWLPVSP